MPISTSEPLQSLVKHESQVQVESELSASDHDLDGQGEETDTAPEAVAEGKDNSIKSEEPAVTRCIWYVLIPLVCLACISNNLKFLYF